MSLFLCDSLEFISYLSHSSIHLHVLAHLRKTCFLLLSLLFSILSILYTLSPVLFFVIIFGIRARVVFGGVAADIVSGALVSDCHLPLKYCALTLFNLSAVASSVCSNGRERINPPRTPSNPERRVDSKLSPSSRAVKLISIVACYIAHGARKS